MTCLWRVNWAWTNYDERTLEELVFDDEPEGRIRIQVTVYRTASAYCLCDCTRVMLIDGVMYTYYVD